MGVGNVWLFFDWQAGRMTDGSVTIDGDALPLPSWRTSAKRPRGEPRPCSKCGRQFQPTRKRWRLCADCFTRGAHGTADDWLYL